jgi:hypothetical protein
MKTFNYAPSCLTGISTITCFFYRASGYEVRHFPLLILGGLSLTIILFLFALLEKRNEEIKQLTRFKYTLPMDIYKELERRVLPYMAQYHTDLTKHDFKAIVGNHYAGPFVFGYRRTGTDILTLDPTIEEMTKEKWLQKQQGTTEEIREKLREVHKENVIFLTYANTNFLYFDGQCFHTCTKEQASQIYLNHIDKICDRWRMNQTALLQIRA